MKHFRSQSLRLKKIVFLYCFHVFNAFWSIEVTKWIFFQVLPDFFWFPSRNTFHYVSFKLRWPMLSTLHITDLPWSDYISCSGKVPPPSRACGGPWEPINPRAKHKGPQRTWSGTCSHSGEHWPATPKPQHPPDHLEMCMDVNWDGLGS